MTKNTLTHASGSLLLEVYPKSIIDDRCKNLGNSEIDHRHVKVESKLRNGLVKVSIIYTMEYYEAMQKYYREEYLLM